MKYFSFVSFLFLFGVFSFSSFKYDKDNVLEININSKYDFIRDAIFCFTNYYETNQTASIKCFTNLIKNDTDDFIEVLNSTETYKTIKTLIGLFNVSEVLLKIIDIMEESVINGTHLIDYIKEALYYKYDTGLDIFYYANFFLLYILFMI